MSRLIWAAAAVAAFVARLFAQSESRQPGLIVHVRDAATSVVMLAPSPAGTWPDGESPDPRIESGKFTLDYRGLLTVPREGKYRFSAFVRGRLKLTINGTSVFGAEAADGHPAAGEGLTTLSSDWIMMPADPVAFICEFQKSAGSARLQLLYESEDFGRVPVPAGVFSHDDASATPELEASLAYDRGRALYEKERCTGCHTRTDSPPMRPGPDLTKIGARAKEAWIFEYLNDPEAHRTGVEMPLFFEPGTVSASERADLARYLSQLGSNALDKKRPRHTPDPANGKIQFALRGCVACHNSPEGANTPETMPRAPLYAPGSKYHNEVALARFIEAPLEFHPAGTMPDLKISKEESLDIAAFLMKARDPQYEKPILPLEPGDSASDSQDRGLQLVHGRGCLSCHSIEGETDGSNIQVPLNDVKKPQDAFRAKHATRPHGRVPIYKLNDGEITDLAAYLSTPALKQPSKSTARDAARMINSMGCLQCHSRNGEGGGLAELQKTALGPDLEDRVEQVAPPDLSGVGSKLRPEWMAEMFHKPDVRARGWLQVRMPHFGNITKDLGRGFAALDGEEWISAPLSNPDDPTIGVIGQDLIGKKGFQCTACHDLAGWEASVAFADARGPDLTLSPKRVREHWFERWLLDPQALSPGTKMPTFFPGGQSTLAGRHGLDANGQIKALYQYLSMGSNAPLPAGLANQDGWSWVVEGSPALIRTPFDEAPRAICIGFPGNEHYPGGVSIGYDAGRGRIFKIWKGGFLRMNGTQWTGQHGPYPHPEGKIIWTAPDDFGQMIITKDPGPAPPAGIAAKPPVFKGYKLEQGAPVFQSEVFGPSGEAVEVQTKILASTSRDVARVDRIISVRSQPAGTVLWVPLLTSDRTQNYTSIELHGSPGSVAAKAVTVPEGPMDRYYARIEGPTGGEAATVQITVHIGSVGSSPRDALPMGPSTWKPAPVTAFDAAPLVGASFDGQPVRGEKPFALEEKSYTIEQLPVPEETVLQGGGLDFLPDGSLVICTRRGEVWILKNATREPSLFKWSRFANGLHEPLGLKVVDGRIFVLQKPEITELIDSDGDGVADRYVCINSGWDLSTNFHEFAFGLEYDKGSFYGTLGLAIIPGGATRPEQVFARGSAFRAGMDGSFEVLALGARTPNGTGLGADGELYYTDNQGDYIPACKLTEVRKGEFYGQRFALPDRNAKVDVVPPVCWLPYGVVSQSASDILYMNQGGSFGPFDGQLIVGDLTNSQLLRVQLETIRGRRQGAVWIFRRGFSSGVERFTFGPDSRLYVTQTTGGWGARGGRLFSLERVAFNGTVPFEMKRVQLLKDGFEIEFTKPLAAGDPTGGNSSAKVPTAVVDQFHYHYWATYGSPEIDRKSHKVTSFQISTDRRRVTLKVEGMIKDRICEIKFRNVTSVDGEPLVHPDVWYTLNEFPE